MNYLTKCVACGEGGLIPFLDLNEQPLANSYHSGEELQKYPLGLRVCVSCWHTQLPVAVNPALMFETYLYVSGTSQTMRDYCDDLAVMIAEREGKTGKVFDIGCNDGTQLDSFKKIGWETYGCDPAKNLTQTALDKGHNVKRDWWGGDYGGPMFDVITAQNVFAHTEDPLGFLRAVKDHLKPDGTCYIQTSQSQMYQRNEFDTTYHEHISFFCANSMKTLTERAGLTLTRIDITSIHGDSYLFTLKHPGSEAHASVQETIDKEISEGRHDIKFYMNFGKNAKKIINALKLFVDHIRSEGYQVVGYGAAAKGMTLLNSNDIQLDWIVDDNPLKQGLYTPGTNIIIKDKSSLDVDDALFVIPLAWNFFEEIKKNVEEIRGNRETKYIKYFPKLDVA